MVASLHHFLNEDRIRARSRTFQVINLPHRSLPFTKPECIFYLIKRMNLFVGKSMLTENIGLKVSIVKLSWLAGTLTKLWRFKASNTIEIDIINPKGSCRTSKGTKRIKLAGCSWCVWQFYSCSRQKNKRSTAGDWDWPHIETKGRFIYSLV